MSAPVPRTPSLRRHKPSGQAVVTLGGKDHYFGPWPAELRKAPPDARDDYDRPIAEWLANGRRLAVAAEDAPRRTVNELILAFWRHAEQHYRRDDGTPTNELRDYKSSLRPLRELYSPTPAAEYSPLKLKAVRQPPRLQGNPAAWAIFGGHHNLTNRLHRPESRRGFRAEQKLQPVQRPRQQRTVALAQPLRDLLGRQVVDVPQTQGGTAFLGH
jgi:hypothetical protein